MIQIRLVEHPDHPLSDDGLTAALAECGYSGSPASERVRREVYCDTFDGRLLGRGMHLIFRPDRLAWELEQEGVRIAAAEGDGDPGFGRALAEEAAGKLGAKRRLIRFLEVTRREAVHESAAPGAGILVVQSLTYRDPHTDREEQGPRVVVFEPGTEPSLPALLRNHLRAADRLFDPFRDGLSRLGIPIPGAPRPGALTLRPEDSIRLAAGKYLVSQSLVLESHRRGAVLDLDPEYVHQLRVAARRSRTALRELGPHLAATRGAAIEKELRWLGRGLGNQRDLDVLTLRLPGMLAKLRLEPATADAILGAFSARRRAAHEDAARALESPRYARLVQELRDLAGRPIRAGAAGPVPGPNATIGTEAPSLIHRALRRVVKRARRPESLGERQLHRVRIAFKRLRYLGELVAPVVDPEVTADLDTLAGFQDCLGDLNDATVARRWFRELARVTCASPAPDPDFLLGLGGLVHLQDAKSTKKSGEFLRRWKRFRAEARRLDRRLASRPPAGGAGSA